MRDKSIHRLIWISNEIEPCWFQLFQSGCGIEWCCKQRLSQCIAYVGRRFHADIDFLEEQLMKWIRRKKMSVLAFTVISQQQLLKAINLEVDGVIIDGPNLN